MECLYNYGISQEDVLTECNALDLGEGDSLICIASAGEIPLGMAALKDARITAVDIAPGQLKLCRIKEAAALNLDSVTAASFLGFMEMGGKKRIEIFNDGIYPYLTEDERKFWLLDPEVIAGGVINSGRFEEFMRKVSAAGRFVVGKKNLYRLFECDSTEQQREIFDRKINGLMVKGIFRVAFHPRIYKNRGIDPAGLTHSGARNIGEFFFQRFRSFCCNTLSRKNFYLQFTFFNRVLFPEALPEFLQPQFHARLLQNSGKIEYRQESIEKTLQASIPGDYNKIHISNIGDWMSRESMSDLFRIIRDRTMPGARIMMRYIHLGHSIPEDVHELSADIRRGYELESHDRYPFYSIVPIIRN